MELMICFAYLFFAQRNSIVREREKETVTSVM